MHEAFAFLAENASMYRFFLKIQVNLMMGSFLFSVKFPL